MHHFLQAGAAGSPGFPPKVLAVPDSRRGPKHQELQVAALAEPAELQQVSGDGSLLANLMESKVLPNLTKSSSDHGKPLLLL